MADGGDQISSHRRAHGISEEVHGELVLVGDRLSFAPLKVYSATVDLQVNRLRKRLEDRKIKLELTDPARKFIGDAGYDPVYGARPLKRYVQQAVETPLAKELVGGKIRDGQTVVVDAADDKLQFRTA